MGEVIPICIRFVGGGYVSDDVSHYGSLRVYGSKDLTIWDKLIEVDAGTAVERVACGEYRYVEVRGFAPGVDQPQDYCRVRSLEVFKAFKAPSEVRKTVSTKTQERTFIIAGGVGGEVRIYAVRGILG